MSESASVAKILVIEHEDKIREVMMFLLGSSFKAHILEARSVHQAVEILQTQNIALVISDYVLPEGSGADVFQYVKKSGKQISFVLCSATKPENFQELQSVKIDGYVDKSTIGDPLIRIIGECLAVLIQDGILPKSVLDEPSHCRVKINSLMRMEIMPCDIYLQLSANKFLKVLNAEDTFGLEEFARFGLHNVEYLYVERKALPVFINKLVKEVFGVTVHQGTGGTEGSIRLSDQIQSTVLELGVQIGMTPEVQMLAKSNADLAIKAIRGNPKLGEIVKHIVTTPESYLCSHSVSLAYIACGLAVIMDWHSDSALYKLSLAAYLHDATLYNQDLAKYRTLVDLLTDPNHKNWSPLDIELFKHHPIKSAELVKQFQDIPAGIDSIILQHHESSDGSGFPYGINHSRIQPLSAIFIIAHDIISEIYKSQKQIDFIDFLKRNEDQYCLGYFKKISHMIAANIASKSV